MRGKDKSLLAHVHVENNIIHESSALHGSQAGEESVVIGSIMVVAVNTRGTKDNLSKWRKPKLITLEKAIARSRETVVAETAFFKYRVEGVAVGEGENTRLRLVRNFVGTNGNKHMEDEGSPNRGASTGNRAGVEGTT